MTPKLEKLEELVFTSSSSFSSFGVIENSSIANKYLRNKKVILHSDGAKTYRLKTTPVDGILHDWVVHKKKKGVIKGKTVWFKPKFVQVVEHRLPDGTIVRAKSGTQIIDRAWSFLRSYLKSRASQVGGGSYTARIRSAQWHYWHQGDDLWKAAGEMLAAW